MGYDEVEDVCDIKYLDYGGYDIVSTDQLRQIRSDFQFLPFQVNIIRLEELYFLENLIPRSRAQEFRQGFLSRKLGKINKVLDIKHKKKLLLILFFLRSKKPHSGPKKL